MDISGVYPALTTPFAPDGSVSLPDLKHNIERYNQTGLAGYVVLGSTGESVLLSRKEMDGILATVKHAAAPEKKLIAGTGAESTAETIERTKRAGEIGYQFALVKTPYYYKPMYNAETYIAHFRRVADASPIPVLLYSVPIFTGVALEAPEVAVLANHPNIVGMKDSSGNVQRGAEIVGSTPRAFRLLVGAAATLLPSLTVGGCGGILALACALPEKCVALYEAFCRGRTDEARELHGLIVRASKGIVSDAGIAGVKFVMDQRGYRGGLPRLPLLPISDRSKQTVLELLASLEPATARA